MPKTIKTRFKGLLVWVGIDNINDVIDFNEYIGTVTDKNLVRYGSRQNLCRCPGFGNQAQVAYLNGMNRKLYSFDRGEVTVLFQEGSVHIVNDKDLWILLEGAIQESTERLVAWIGRQYRQLWGKELAITADSLAVEIWGHVYFEYYLLILKELVRMRLVEELMQGLLEKSEVIDCGEAGVDNNRRLWDMLAPHKDFILGMLPGKIDPGQKEEALSSPPT